MVIERESLDGVEIVRLARGKVNALDLELVTAITETFTSLGDGSVRPIVLTGSGKAFSAGVDLPRVLDGGPGYVRRFLPALADAFEAVFSIGRPVVAAVNGHAIAGGCILATACDHRIMGEAGSIGVTELAVGVPFPLSAMEILRFAVGDGPARRAVFEASTFTADEALTRGFVDEVVGSTEVVSRAVQAARRLAGTIPAETYEFTKWQLRHDVNERLARLRPEQDRAVTRLWEASLRDGSIGSYLERLRRGTAEPR
ncbi:MAG: enoyl-CoA hydratase/isomerase family protein [Pseudonocardiaceae bacterium]|nr:enoyl-CoA hydratase/isomerase family protein [Pseudonocardiaceae bacterium]